MSLFHLGRRAAVLATTSVATASIATAAVVALAGPAAAMPFEGDPGRGGCVRVVSLPGFERSPDVFSTGLVTIVVPRSRC